MLSKAIFNRRLMRVRSLRSIDRDIRIVYQTRFFSDVNLLHTTNTLSTDSNPLSLPSNISNQNLPIEEKKPLIITAADLHEKDFRLANYDRSFELDPESLAEYIDEYGSFQTIFYDKTKVKLVSVVPHFQISSPLDHLEELQEVKKFFRTGELFDYNFNSSSNGGSNAQVHYMVTNVASLQRAIIPFLKKFPLKKQKKEFMKFRILTSLIGNFAYSTEEGMEKLKRINNDDYELDEELKKQL